MRVQVKLYAALSAYLPAAAQDNVFEMDLADGATPADVITALGLPGEMCHLVLLNGVYVAPAERATTELNAGDALAMWPPVAGGSRA